MFIRNDLLNKIKEIYEIKEFNYTGAERGVYHSTNNPFLLFTTNKNLIAIRQSVIGKGVYHLSIVEKYDFYYFCGTNNYILKMEKNETVLTKIYSTDAIEHKFPGKAFDFEKKFVAAALENSHRSTPRRGCC